MPSPGESPNGGRKGKTDGKVIEIIGFKPNDSLMTDWA